MSAAPDATHRVAVFGTIRDPHPLAEILCEVLHEQRTDAVIHAHHAPGVLQPVMSVAQAERVVSLLHGLGVQACAVAVADLPNFDDATIVHHARLTDAGVEIVDYRGDVAERIPWGNISLVALGDVPQDVRRHDIGSTRPLVSAAPVVMPSPLSVPMATGPELWWTTTDPVRLYRVDHRQMNYEALGNRKTDSATTNFRLFAADFCTSAMNAWKTPAVRAYLDHHPAGQYTFSSSAELQREAMLHWVMGRTAGP
jgi:hypothetical protein